MSLIICVKMADDEDEFVNMLPVRKVMSDLVAAVSNADTRDEMKLLIEKHIADMETKELVYMPQLRQDLDWINTNAPLIYPNHLKGKVVLYDFFTYCCINCMHILPYLADLEKKFTFEDGLIVVGVHSAKFDNERLSENIENAILRHDIKHPVINDHEAALWNQFSIQCWPTILIVGPENQILFELVGEGGKEILDVYVETTLNYFKNYQRISSHQLPVATKKQKDSSSALYFPSKLNFNHTGDLLAIADSGNNRILVVNRDGYVKHTIGGPDAGFYDGKFHNAQFRSPQGLTWLNSFVICVADTGNHSIREINLETKLVRTLVGTGKQGDDKIGVSVGTEQSLSSPWDIVLNEKDNNSQLPIAMAGHHQIWNYFCHDSLWLQNEFKAKSCVAIAGSGNEENRNNTYAHKSSFAQPSGLAVGVFDDHRYLFIADSESSTIRQMSLENGSVKGLVGGERDPKNLFGFGDNDGIGISVKLQHPLGIAWNKQNCVLYISDTYNHKIKVIDPRDKSCKTICGSGKPGNKFSNDLLNCELNEPNGLTFDPNSSDLFIADTNNHVIKILNLKSSTLSQFTIHWNEQTRKKMHRRATSHTDTVVCDEVKLKQGGSVKLIPQITFQEGLVVNKEAPNKCKVYLPPMCDSLTVAVDDTDPTVPLYKILATVDNLNPPVTVELETTFYFCKKDDGVCLMRSIVFQIPISVCNNEGLDNSSVDLKYRVQIGNNE